MKYHEPWRIVEKFGERGIADSENGTICYRNAYDELAPQLHQMQRIVACVNACAGMDDPEAVIKALRETEESYNLEH